MTHLKNNVTWKPNAMPLNPHGKKRGYSSRMLAVSSSGGYTSVISSQILIRKLFRITESRSDLRRPLGRTNRNRKPRLTIINVQIVR